ncbi:MAG: TonB family protein [Rhodopseudomonas sp.]|nr:TonB family protein [Rhodopseudomonas sp.]
MIRRLPSSLRWGLCFSVALGLHAATATALIVSWHDTADLVANSPVVMVDLAPVAVAPRSTPTDDPPAPVERKQQIEPDPTPDTPPELTEIEPAPTPEPPVEKVEVPPEPAPEPELAMLPPPKPPIEEKIEKPIEKKVERKKRRHRVASLASAPSAADRKADRAEAPMPGAAAQHSNALPDWQSRLVAQIIRNKRYPAEALSRGDHGTVQVSFRVDRSGGIHNARVVRSSGSSVLDRDALAWLDRSQPLPPPPPSVQGTSFAFHVPLRYTLR